MLYILTNCTSGKKLLPKNKHLFRNYQSNDINKTIFEWKKNLLDTSISIEAQELYKGVSWKAVLDAKEEFNKEYETKLLISSAGYGLIDSRKKIIPYGITFSRNQLDSISQKFSNIDWWNGINEFPETAFDNITAIFICLSQEYINSMHTYLVKLINRYKERIFIINISKKKNENIKGYYLNFDKRFNSFEAGTMVSLGQRCLRWLSKEIVNKNLSLEYVGLQKHIDEFLNQFEYQTIKSGNKLSDKELEQFIKEQINNKKVVSASNGLVILRKSGYSCEQKRFHTLFRKVKAEV